MAIDPSTRLELADQRRQTISRRAEVLAAYEQFLIDREVRATELRLAQQHRRRQLPHTRRIFTQRKLHKIAEKPNAVPHQRLDDQEAPAQGENASQ